MYDYLSMPEKFYIPKMVASTMKTTNTDLIEQHVSLFSLKILSGLLQYWCGYRNKKHRDLCW